MIRFLLRKLEIPLADFIIGNRVIDQGSVQSIIENVTEEELAPLWNRETGLCTSFCIWVSSIIDNSETTRFTFADFERQHRASFSMDKIIVDSSARKILQASDSEELIGYKGIWKLEDTSRGDTVLWFRVN